MDDSGILPLACIPAIHGGHAAVERAMDGLAKSRYHEAKRPSEHQQADRSADLLHSFPNGSFGFADIRISTHFCEES